jgi:hypothetical protein
MLVEAGVIRLHSHAANALQRGAVAVPGARRGEPFSRENVRHCGAAHLNVQQWQKMPLRKDVEPATISNEALQSLCWRCSVG